MRLGCSTWGMPAAPFEESIPRLAAIGYHGIEIAVLPRFRTALESLGTDEQARLRDLADTHGLTITALAAHTPLLATKQHDASIEVLRGAIDLSAELVPDDPPVVTTTPGGAPEQWDAVKYQLADEYGRLGAWAADRGVTLGIEPHVGGAVDEPHEIRWLMEQIDAASVRINLDYSHFLAHQLSLEESVMPLLPWVVHSHIKGNRGRWPSNEFLVPGEDEFDYTAYLRTLHEMGYRGWQSVEVSVTVQARPNYEPYAAAQLAYDTLAAGFEQAGLPGDD